MDRKDRVEPFLSCVGIFVADREIDQLAELGSLELLTDKHNWPDRAGSILDQRLVADKVTL